MRAKQAKIREVMPDPIYNSTIVTRLINRIMERGKKSIAQKLVYTTFDILEQKTSRPAIEVFEQAIANVTPKLEVRSRRVGGAAYQVPTPVKSRRAVSLALRWLVNEANKRSSKEYHSFAEKLTAEILDATENAGGAVQKKLTSHKMAEANKAFAHFRW